MRKQVEQESRYPIPARARGVVLLGLRPPFLPEAGGPSDGAEVMHRECLGGDD
jgi:hypothetical protein